MEASQQVGEPRVGSEVIPYRIDPEKDKVPRVVRVGLFEPFEGILFIAEGGVNVRDKTRRHVTFSSEDFHLGNRVLRLRSAHRPGPGKPGIQKLLRVSRQQVRRLLILGHCLFRHPLSCVRLGEVTVTSRGVLGRLAAFFDRAVKLARIDERPREIVLDDA